MCLKRLALCSAIGAMSLLQGCVSEDAAAHEPTAKSQSISTKGYPADSAYSKDIKDQKSVAADEAASKG